MVEAGLIPNEPDPQYTMRFSYTSDDFERDKELPPHQQKLPFLIAEADEYARNLPFPMTINWVNVNRMWM